VIVASLALAAAETKAASLIRDAEIENIIRSYAAPLFRAGGLDPDAVAGQQPGSSAAGEGGQVRVERVEFGGQGPVAAGQVAQGAVGRAGRVGAAPGLLGHQAPDSLGGRQRVPLGV